MLHQEPSNFLSFCGGFLALEAQGHPLEQLDQGIEGGMLVIGRTLARREPRLGLGGHVFLQHLHQARFAQCLLRR